MYYRIVGELSWQSIEGMFAGFFSLRTRDGLTSVYYRTRKEWGMEEVLENKFCPASDREKVEDEDGRFSRAFLQDLGYRDQLNA